MIINRAKYISENELLEEEIDIEVNNVKIKGFMQIVAYPIKIGCEYSVNLGLTIFDEVIEELPEPKYGIENIGGGFAYHLYGKLDKNILKLGSFDIQDEQLLNFSEFDGKFIHLFVNRISVELI